MSRIVNDDFVAGQAVTTTALNEKFDDVVTATTGALDADNFGAESIDVNQFATVSNSGKSGIILVDWQKIDNGLVHTGGTDYTSTVNTNPPVELSHGSGCRLTWPLGRTLEVDDILRVNFAVAMEQITTYNWALYPFIDYDRTNDPVWCVWLQWDVTSNALANWTEVPNQGDLRDNFFDAEGSTTDNLQATMTIPHGWRYYDGVQRHNEDDAATASAGFAPQTKVVHRRTYNYVNESGSTITIYGLRLVINGLYHAEYSADTGNKNALEKDNDATGWKDEQVRIAGVWHSALVMRTK